jgi:2,4-dienoyl-CoA reductase-like NADH-dependent reductase (Old Yellow Enzyme family)/thioredoxin reductase
MKIANIELRNNIIMAPVKTGYNNGNGEITDRHIAFWERRANDVGAIIFEPFYLDRNVRELPTQIGLDNDEQIGGHKKLVKAVKSKGAKTIAHLNHPGRMANPKIPDNIFLSASDMKCPNHPKTPKTLTIDEIKNIQQKYVDAAIRAEQAGYDMLELQFGLGYLIAQFLSPDTNKREDKYGGGFENRIRFGLEILSEIKEKANLPLIARISGDEMHPMGMNISDAIETAKVLEKEGIAAIHVTAGNACLTPPWYYQHHFIPKGKNWEMAAKIKKEVNIPIITVGQINEFSDIDKINNDNLADFIALGRALIADPDFVGKYLNKSEEAFRPCSACLTGCLGRIKIGKGLQCEINPLVGKELEIFNMAEQSKNIAVIGGGLSGMEAALTLKKRGHKVTLFEKNKLGGQFNYAPMPSQKESLQKQIDFYKEELKSIELIQKETTPEDIINKFDTAVIATGSEPFIPPINGLKDFYWAEILEKENIPKDKNVLVIGGGLIGVEIANTLVDYNNKVTIVELLSDIARDMEMISRKLNLMKLQKNNIAVFTETKVTSVDGTTVNAEKVNSNEKISFENIDIIVLATGMKSVHRIGDNLKDKMSVHFVGDANEVGDAVSAIQSAYNICKEL